MSTPKNPDEYLLWNAFGAGSEEFRFPFQAAEALGIPKNRARYLVRKWTKAHIYEPNGDGKYGWKNERYPLFAFYMRKYWLGDS